jgi:hypothetical protein
VGEHRPVQRLQRGAGLDTDLLAKVPPYGAVCVESIGLSAR